MVLRSLPFFSLLGCFMSMVAAEDSVVDYPPDPRAVKSGLYIKVRPGAEEAKVAFTVREPSGVARENWPVRGAIPLYRGELSDPSRIRLLDAGGKEIPVQGLATAFWPERTIRFLCIDFLTTLKPNEEKQFTLEYGSKVTPKSATALKVDGPGDAGNVSVNTGKLVLEFKPGASFLAWQVPGGGKRPITGRAMVAKSDKGNDATAHGLVVDTVSITEQGPVQATVHLLGHYGTQKADAPSSDDKAWRYPVSMFFRVYGDTAHVYVEHTFGYNGNEHSDFVQSYGLNIATGLAGGTFQYGPDESTAARSALGVRLNQFAHDQWVLSGKESASGKRFGGWAAVSKGKQRVTVALREAWQNWPVAIRAEPNGDLFYEILGEKEGRALDLRYEATDKRTFIKSHSMYVGEGLSTYYMGSDVKTHGRAKGIRKIHELMLDFGSSSKPEALGKAHQDPLAPWAGATRFADTKVMGHIAVYDDPKWDFVKEYYSVLLDCLPVAHEAKGLYGWVDWGDLPMFNRARDGSFKLLMEGGVGWSNGERAMAAYLYHYAAGGGRRFLNLGRAMVHHTIGIDVEHEGGDIIKNYYTMIGTYHRHNQVHWRHDGAGSTRQGGYRGWHNYYWLTGDPEVGRLALKMGIDAPSQQIPWLICDYQSTASQSLAHWCWITSGDWKHARFHRGLCRLWEICGEEGRPIKGGWYGIKITNHEPSGFKLAGKGPLGGYWMTYGGDDLVAEWASLTGDPHAVNALLLQGRLHKGGGAVYHSPEAMYMALAYLHPRHPKLKGYLEKRLWMTPGLKAFRDGKRKSREHYDSAGQWSGLGSYCFGKNGFSIYAAQAVEVLYTLHALKHLAGDPPVSLTLPELKLPGLVSVPKGKQTCDLKVDGRTTVSNPETIAAYQWSVDGKPAATTAEATLKLDLGLHRVGLALTDKDGVKVRSEAPIIVNPEGLYRFKFGGGPDSFLDGNRLYDASRGFGWDRRLASNQITENKATIWKEKAKGCGFLFLWRQVVFQLKVPPGKYRVEIGGAEKWQMKQAPVSLQGKVVVAGKQSNSRGVVWSYSGDVTVGTDGMIKVQFDRGKTGALGIVSYVIAQRMD